MARLLKSRIGMLARLMGLALVVWRPSEAPGFERRDLLPENPVAVLEITDSVSLVKAFAQTPFGRLWQDDGIRRFVGGIDMTDILRDILMDGRSPEKARLEWDQLMMLTGEVLVVFESGAAVPALVARISEEDFQRSLVMDDRIAALETERTLTIRRHTFQGIDLVQHITELPDQDAPVETWQGCSAETLVLGSDRDWVERSLARLMTDAPREPPAGPPSIRLHLNVPHLIETFLENVNAAGAAAAGTAPAPTPGIMLPDIAPDAIFRALGLTAMGPVRMEIEMPEDRTVFRFHAQVSDLSRGLFAMIDPRPVPPAFRAPFNVPANAHAYVVSSLDLPALPRQIPVILKEIQPALAPQADMFWSGLEIFLGIHLDRDLLSHLDTRLLSFSSRVGDQLIELHALQVKDVVRVRDALARMLGEGRPLRLMLDGVLGETEFLDVPVFLFDFGANAAEDDPAANNRPVIHALAVDGGYLFYGSELGVRHVIRSLHASGGIDAGFHGTPLARRLQAVIPPDAFQFSVLDGGEFLKTMLNDSNYATFQAWAETAAREAAGDGNGTLPRWLERIDFSHWPTVRHLASFLGDSVSYSLWDGESLETRTIWFHDKAP